MYVILGILFVGVLNIGLCGAATVIPPTNQCNETEATFLDCDSLVVVAMVSGIQTAGGNSNFYQDKTILQQAATEIDKMYDVTVNVFCSTSALACVTSGEYVELLAECPQYADNDQLTSAVHVDLIQDNQLNNISTACDFFNTERCTTKDGIFSDCFNTILDNIGVQASDVDFTQFCQANNVESTDCVMDMYKGCSETILANDLLTQPTKDLITKDQWELYDNAQQLCDCYEMSSCYTDLKFELNSNIQEDVRDRAFRRAKVLCSPINQERLTCASNVTLPDTVCGRMFVQFERDVETIENWQTIPTDMCTVVNTDFDGNFSCIKENLPVTCFNEIDTSSGVCRGLRTMYMCVYNGLQGKCGKESSDLEFVHAVFDMIRSYHENIPQCSAVPIETCSSSNANFLACDSALQSAITAVTPSIDLVSRTADLSNDTQAQLYYEVMNDAYCSEVAGVVQPTCFRQELNACPSLLFDAGLSSILPAAQFIDENVIGLTDEAACDLLQQRECALKKQRFNACMSIIRGVIGATNIDFVRTDDFCGTDRISSTTCVIEMYRDCPTEVLTNNVVIVPEQTQAEMQVQQWEKFANGQEFCDCRIGTDDFDRIEDSIQLSADFHTISSPIDIYQRAYLLSDTLCNLLPQLERANGVKVDACRTVFKTEQTTYDRRLLILNNYQSTTDMCPSILNKYDGNLPCIREKLLAKYAPCRFADTVPEVDLTGQDCSALEAWYVCVKEALVGECGLSPTNYTYVNAAYDMMRVYERSLPVCDDIKLETSGSSQQTIQHLLLSWTFICSILYSLR